MNIPETIIDWIDERISFSTLLTTSKNIHQVSDAIYFLEDFKYCKKLLIKIENNPNDFELKNRFKSVAKKLILDSIYELDKQQNECIFIHGICFPTSQKIKLPIEVQDNFNNTRLALEKILNQVIEL